MTCPYCIGHACVCDRPTPVMPARDERPTEPSEPWFLLAGDADPAPHRDCILPGDALAAWATEAT